MERMAGAHGAGAYLLADKLLQEVCFGSKRELLALFADGEVDVEGDKTKGVKPLLAAAGTGNAENIEVLIARGAKVNAPSKYNVPIFSGSTELTVEVGERALHCSAKSGELQATRTLLRAGAEPTCFDAKGCTPISLAAAGPSTEGQFLEVARALIEAGADATVANNVGRIPLHGAAHEGNVDMIDLLLSEAPHTINVSSKAGETPLYVAALGGSGEAVSRLLAAGAVHSSFLAACPLIVAAQHGNEDAVRVLIEEGLEAIGGSAKVIPFAVTVATISGNAKTLGRLLDVEGEEKREFWARFMFDGMRSLHFAAGYSRLSATRVLLAAGADESDTDSVGRTPRAVIGNMKHTGVLRLPRDQVREKELIGRALERGPAFRARSWVWPTGKGIAAGGRDSTAATVVTLSQIPVAKRHLRTRLRIARSQNANFFVDLLGR